MANISPFFRNQNQSKYAAIVEKKDPQPDLTETDPLLFPAPNRSRYSIGQQQQHSNTIPSNKWTEKKSILPLVFTDTNTSTAERGDNLRHVPSHKPLSTRRTINSTKASLTSSNTRKSAYTFIEATTTRWVWFLLLFPILTISLVYQVQQLIKYKRWDERRAVITDPATMGSASQEIITVTSPPIIGRSAVIRSQLLTISRAPPAAAINSSVMSFSSLLPSELSLPISFTLLSHIRLHHHPNASIAEDQAVVIVKEEMMTGSLFDYDDRLMVHLLPLPVINMEDHLLHWNTRDTLTSYEVQVTINCSAASSPPTTPLSGCMNLTEVIFEGYSYTTAYSILTSAEALVLGMIVVIVIVKLVSMTWKTGKHQMEVLREQLSSYLSPSPSSTTTFLFHPLDFILPEQYAAFFLLISLFFYLNVLGSVTMLLSSARSLQESSGVTWIYLCCLLRSIGKYGLWFGLYVLITGLQYNSNDYEERVQLQRLKSSSFLLSSSSTSSLSYDEKVAAIERLIHPVYETSLTKAHPRSSQYLDFLLPKLLFLLFSWTIAAIYWLFHLKVLSDRITSPWITSSLRVGLEMTFFAWMGLVLWVICCLR